MPAISVLLRVPVLILGLVCVLAVSASAQTRPTLDGLQAQINALSARLRTVEADQTDSDLALAELLLRVDALERATTCKNGVQDGGETDVDCGGPACGSCGNGLHCLENSDCVEGLCVGGVCQANAAHCSDNVKNAGESDVDCGGPTCAKCANGKTCGANVDCQSGICTNGICQAAPSCTDRVKNGSESDVDCGGSCQTKCATTQTCNVATDCQSGVCIGGTCRAPSCSDGVYNGSETDVDCGGACAKCANYKRCSVASDCQSGKCVAGTCQP